MKNIILILIIGMSLAADACSSTSDAETTTGHTNSVTAENAKINLRRQIAAAADGKFSVASSLEGPDQTVLVLTTDTWAKLLADKYMSNSWATVDFDKAGIVAVKFRSRDKSPELVYDIATRSFTK
jgi:hypothetical protein